MDIRQAKDQIKNAMLAYFSKDEFGNYRLPTERQRPVFLLGAPGIGKTAIMEQIAQDLDVGFVSYSMTHHTRQSAASSASTWSPISPPGATSPWRRACTPPCSRTSISSATTSTAWRLPWTASRSSRRAAGTTSPP